MSEKEMANVYETLLSVPGMNEQVKIDLRLPRKTVLLLAQVIEKGMQVKKGEKETGWTATISNEQSEELKEVVNDCLGKAGLTDLSIKLNNLAS